MTQNEGIILCEISSKTVGQGDSMKGSMGMIDQEMMTVWVA